MNRLRRSRISAIILALQNMVGNEPDNIEDRLNDVYAEIEDVCSEEEDTYDNYPPNLMESDNGYAMQEAIDNLYLAMDCIEEAKSADSFSDASVNIEEAISALEEIVH